MSVLYCVLTHRSPDDVAVHLEALRRALPAADPAICYGGPREMFERLPPGRKVFLAEPTLRRPVGSQSYASVLRDIHSGLVEPSPEVTVIHLIEFDHVIVHRGYETELLRVMAATGADWLGRHCVDRTHTNWEHGLRVQDDDELYDFLADLGDDPERSHVRLFGGIADGATMTRSALERFVAVDHHLDRYVEFYVPTVMQQLGLRVRDACRVSTIFDHVRYAPPYDRREIAALTPGQAFALHPVKDYADLPQALSLLGDVPPAAAGSSVRSPSPSAPAV
jgi:hypothetical protein